MMYNHILVSHLFLQTCSYSIQRHLSSLQLDVYLVNIFQHLNHVIVSFNFNVMLMSHVLDKDDDVICFLINYSSIQLFINADLDHFVVKKQRVHVFFFNVQHSIHVFFF